MREWYEFEDSGEFRPNKAAEAVATKFGLTLLEFAERAFSPTGFPELECLVYGNRLVMLCRDVPAPSPDRATVRPVYLAHHMNLLDRHKAAYEMRTFIEH